MSLDTNSISGPDRAWRNYLLLLVIVFGFLAALGLQNTIDEVFGQRGPARVQVLTPERLSTHEGAVLGGVLLAFVAVGLVIAAGFLAGSSRTLQAENRPRIQPNILFVSFLVYFFGFLGLSVLAQMIGDLAGFSEPTRAGAIATLVLQGLGMLGALGLGLSALRVMATYTGEDPREIGLRMCSWRDSVKWGVAGYLGAIPFILAAAVFTQALAAVLFHGVRLPQHPIVPELQAGGWTTIVAGIVAVVIAPIVEEIGFRGLLYGALRGKMGVWQSAVLSGVFFAAIHPAFPVMLLPILVLGTALALLRERTGSLVPGMVCHAVNNGLMLLLARQLG